MTTPTTALAHMMRKPFTVLTEDEVPDYHSLRKLQKEADAVARKVATGWGSGLHGFLTVTQGQAEYLKITGTEWPTPTNPGIHVSYPAGASYEDKETSRENHRAHVKEWENYKLVNEAILDLLTDAVPKKYYRPMIDKMHGIADRTPFEILDHLWKTYGDITQDIIIANEAKIDLPWDMSSPILDLWERIDDIKEFAIKADKPVDDQNIMHRVLLMFKEGHLFKAERQSWHGRKPRQKTLDKFKEKFGDAYDYHKKNATAKSAGYAK